MVKVHQLDPYKVGEITTLGMRDDATARDLLSRIALQVQPLLRTRRFQVPRLAEFFPPKPNLLGLNCGGGGGKCTEIMVRLRCGRTGAFFPYEAALDTMLHEITHNVVGPHNSAFYKLYDELKAECEDLIVRGVRGTGAGFDANPAGKAGGRFIGRELAPHQRREEAAKAAEQRARKTAAMPAGPRRLGGDTTLREGCDPRQAAAIAAERRERDNVWCPTERLGQDVAGQDVHAALREILDKAQNGQQASTAAGAGSSAQAHRQQHSSAVKSASHGPTSHSGAASAADFVDLTAEDGGSLLPLHANPKRRRTAGAAPAWAGGTGWQCDVCTLWNRPLALQCDACLRVREQPA